MWSNSRLSGQCSLDNLSLLWLTSRMPPYSSLCSYFYTFEKENNSVPFKLRIKFFNKFFHSRAIPTYAYICAIAAPIWFVLTVFYIRFNSFLFHLFPSKIESLFKSFQYSLSYNRGSYTYTFLMSYFGSYLIIAIAPMLRSIFRYILIHSYLVMN